MMWILRVLVMVEVCRGFIEHQFGVRPRSPLFAKKGFAQKSRKATTPKKPTTAKKTPPPIEAPQEPEPIAPEVDDSLSQQDIFAKYGLKTAEEKMMSKPKEEEEISFQPLKNIPPGVQQAAEQVFVVGIVILLVAFILIGLGIMVEAFAVATESPLPEDIRHVIVDLMEPQFTPILVAGFACSISLGALKTLQLSSDAVQYSEDDEIG